MSRLKQRRQPLELLREIEWHLLIARLETPRKWAAAATQASKDINALIKQLPSDPPKRNYYGQKGSTRNPFRA